MLNKLKIKCVKDEYIEFTVGDIDATKCSYAEIIMEPGALPRVNLTYTVTEMDIEMDGVMVSRSFNDDAK